MFLQETDLNVVPGGIIPVMHVSQYDVGRELKFVLYDGYDTADITTGMTVTIEGTKPDGHGFQYSGVLDQSAHTATFVTTEQMTVLAGAIECKLTLYLNSQRIGTALFILDVEKAGINDSTIISDTELPLIIAQATEQMERAEAAADAAALSETNAAASETNAATSETNAANSEIICGSFMRMAGVSAASAEQSAIISGSFMRTAGNYADEAEASAASANMDALKSEGHALGTQNGTPVSSDSPYYHNNAKYWADEARQSSAGGVAARVIATAEPTNISSHAYAPGDQFVYNGILYTATSAISVGSTITPGTNCSISDTITEQIGNAGHTILDEDGTTYPQRSKLQFNGAKVSDDSENDATVVETVNPVDYEEDIHGVNLIPYPYHQSSRTIFGCTFTVNNDGTVVAVSGTPTEDIRQWMQFHDGESLVIPNGTYTLTGCPSGGSNSTYSICARILKNGEQIELGDDFGNGLTFTVDGDDYYTDKVSLGIFVRVYSGATVDNVVFHPMLRKATIQDDTYRPYNQQSIQNQLTEQTNVLGAKNRFEQVVHSHTYNGITYNYGSDSIVTLNGTASAGGNGGNVTANGEELIKLRGRYILSAEIISGSASAFVSFGFRKSSTGFWELRDLHSKKKVSMEVNLTDEEHLDGWSQIYVASRAVCTDFKFRIMIRSASDPDDTYVHYAMTNRELTEVTTETLVGTFNRNNSLMAMKCGKMVTLVFINTPWSSVKSLTLPAKYRPSVNIAFPVIIRNGNICYTGVWSMLTTGVMSSYYEATYGADRAATPDTYLIYGTFTYIAN